MGICSFNLLLKAGPNFDPSPSLQPNLLQQFGCFVAVPPFVLLVDSLCSASVLHFWQCKMLGEVVVVDVRKD